MSQRKINIILDIDQTLISSEETNKFNFKNHKKKMEQFEHINFEDLYVIFARPHLQGFLDFLFDNFNVSIWTAASKNYALFIVDKFILTKPNRKIDFIFFSYHCKISMKNTKNLKDISLLWDYFKLTKYAKDNTIIIDDNPVVKDAQVCNCFAIKPFYILGQGSENDSELISLTSKLESLKTYLENNKTPDCLMDVCV